MDGLNFEIKECTVGMYPEFIDQIDTAFSYKSGWFLAELGHVLPPPAVVKHADTAKHLVALHNGIIGAVGFYPMDIIASDGTDSVSFKLGGVGQVSCLREYRKHGVMSALMNAGIKRMRDDGTELSWLSGLRSRYANFGYELGGGEINYTVLARDIKHYVRPGEGREFIAAEDDIGTLDALYRNTAARIDRDNELWRRHISRDSLEWRICEIGDKKGYVARYTFNNSGIWEVAGDGECVLTLLARHMNEYSKDFITIKYPICHDSLSDYLYRSANGVNLAPNGMYNILDRDGVYDKILPFIKRQCGRFVDGDGVMGILNNPDTATIDEVTAKMLGFTYSPRSDRFEFLKPLALYISRPDEV